MNAIIEGKRYNTENAELVAEYYSESGRRSFRYFEERLYRTRKGTWFLVGEGRALSPYAEVVEQSRRPGRELRPLTEEDVRHWMELTENFDSLEEFFAEHIEDA